MLCSRCHHGILGDKPSRRATWALAFAALGFLGFVPGLVALILGQQELNAIHAGEASGAGEGLAKLARDMGWFHLGMLVVIAIGLAFRS